MGRLATGTRRTPHPATAIAVATPSARHPSASKTCTHPHALHLWDTIRVYHPRPRVTRLVLRDAWASVALLSPRPDCQPHSTCAVSLTAVSCQPSLRSAPCLDGGELYRRQPQACQGLAKLGGWRRLHQGYAKVSLIPMPGWVVEASAASSASPGAAGWPRRRRCG